eukprot:5415671-Prymnesium_polylepis.1
MQCCPGRHRTGPRGLGGSTRSARSRRPTSHMRVVKSRTAWRRRTEARVAVRWSYALRNPMMAAVAGVA